MDEERRLRITRSRQRIGATLSLAAVDLELRQRLLDNPRSVLATPNDTSPSLPPHVQEMRRNIISQLVDRASTDPEFRAQLAHDLPTAVRAAGLSPQVEQLRAELPANAEVMAYSSGWGGDGWGGGSGWGGDGWGGGWG
jgi:hypothetical protein